MSCNICRIKLEVERCEDCNKKLNKCGECLLSDLKKYLDIFLENNIDKEVDIQKIKETENQIKNISKLKNKCWYCI